MSDKFMEQIEAVHAGIREYAEFLDKMPGKIVAEKKWTGLEKVEQFFVQELRPHFTLEEETVFPSLAGQVPETLISTLIAEHARILDSVDEMEVIIRQQVLPLPNDVIRKLNEIIIKLSAQLLDHATKEDEQIYPLYKPRQP